MAKQPDSKNGAVILSWIITVIMLGSAWPIGLFLLFRMLTVGYLIPPKKVTSGPIDVKAREIRSDEPVRRRSPSKTTAPQTIDRKWGRNLMIIGAVLAVIFGWMLIDDVVEILAWGWYSYMASEMLFESGLAATGILVLSVGISRRKKASRYRRYIQMIGKQESLSIDTLAKALPVSYRRACSDLQDMLDLGYLPAGYVDALNRRIVFSDKGIQEEPAVPKQAPPKKSEIKEENDILAEIQAINDDIDDEAMSAKIDRIREITRKILDFQAKNPDADAELHSFLNYYLPTTLKILRSYAQLEDQGIEGENISATKARIEGMMDMVVKGFEKRLDKLFQSDALDISSDVSVLEQMLQRDGLAGEAFPGPEIKVPVPEKEENQA